MQTNTYLYKTRQWKKEEPDYGASFKLLLYSPAIRVVAAAIARSVCKRLFRYMVLFNAFEVNNYYSQVLKIGLYF